MAGVSHTQVTNTSFGGNLLAAIAGVGIGVLLFLGSFPFLWWNEGRLDVSTVAKKALVVAPDGAGGGEGEVISVTAGLATTESIGDPLFLRPAVHVSLGRKAEMWSWKEEKKTEEKKKLGGGTEKVTTWDYVPVWAEEPADSSRFEYAQSHENPHMAVRSETFFAARATVGAFGVAPKDVGLPPAAPLAVADAMLVPLTPHADPELAKLRPRRDGAWIYLGAGSIAQPAIGDVRVSFASVDPTPGPVTLYGVRHGTDVGPWVEPDKLLPEKLYRVVPGTHAQAVATLHGEYVRELWVFRLLGFLAMWIGLTLLLGPLNAVLDVVPFVGKAGRMVTTLVMFPLAAALSGLTILLAIVAHHPALLAVPVLAAIVIFTVVRLRRRSAPA